MNVGPMVATVAVEQLSLGGIADAVQNIIKQPSPGSRVDADLASFEGGALHPAQLAIFTDAVPDTLILNLTATNGTAPSDFLSIYPAGVSYPGTSDVNFLAGDTRANHAVVRLGGNGQVALYNAAGQVDAIVDLSGYYTN